MRTVLSPVFDRDLSSDVPSRFLRASAAAATLVVSIAAFSAVPVNAAPPASSTASVSAADKLAASAVRISPGDTLSIEVLGKPEFARTVTILSDGKLAFPYLGEVQAAGMTIADLTAKISKGLSTQIASPQVVITLTKRRETRVAIMGSVHQTGKFALEEGWRVLDLLAESGGLSVDKPEWYDTNLVRGATSIPINLARLEATGDPADNLLLEPGDILLVREKDASQTQVQVLGGVAKPGFVAVPDDGSVAGALSEAGGAIPRAKLKNAVIRRNGTTIPVDLSQPIWPEVGSTASTTPGTTAPIRLQPGDTLVIPMNALSFTVYGAVANPGSREYPEKQQVTAVGALLDAGGASGDSDLKNSSVVRISATGSPLITPIDLEAAMKGAGKGKDASSIKGDVALQPGDVLYVPTKKASGGHASATQAAVEALPLIGLFMR